MVWQGQGRRLTLQKQPGVSPSLGGEALTSLRPQPSPLDQLSSHFCRESRTHKVSTQAKPHFHLEVGGAL